MEGEIKTLLIVRAWFIVHKIHCKIQAIVVLQLKVHLN